MPGLKLLAFTATLVLSLATAECRATERSVEHLGEVTLVILPFENNSVTDPERFAPLSKGLAAMLITDLSNSETRLKLVEREKIQALLKEIALSQSGSVDESTGIEAGKVLGAQTIAIGSFMVLAKKVRIDARIIKVETGEVIMAESIMGDSDDFMDLERELAQRIADSFKVGLRSKGGKSKGDISAALCFARGLEAMDRGEKAEARRLFRKSIKLDPAYRAQVDEVKGL